MTTLLVLVLLGYVIILDRKVGMLRQSISELEQQLWARPQLADEPAAAWVPQPEPEVAAVGEQELPRHVLVAEQRSPAVAEPIAPIPEPEVGWVEEPAPWPRRPQISLSFEDLFGRKLPIWGGGITLAVAGFLIVKYSIDAGFFSPALRVVAGLLFGGALIGGGEWARRRADYVRDERVAQALAGAGIASLYGSLLVAANLYDLVGAGMTLGGMALVTALALWLAPRFGSPSALLGLAGGLAAPALVGSDAPNVPLLMLYLALAMGGLTAVSRRQRWAWLGVGALIGGFGWGLLLLVAGALDLPSTIAVGLFLLLLGLVLPGFAVGGDARSRVQLVAAAAAAVQIAALVATGGFGWVQWSLFGLLALAVQWLRRREPSLALLPPLALAIGLLLVAIWPDPSPAALAAVLISGGAIFGLPAGLRLWRPGGSLVEAGQLAALALGAQLLVRWHGWGSWGTDFRLGLLAFGLAGLVGAAAAAGWRNGERLAGGRFTLLATITAVLLGIAASHLLPGWAISVGVAAVALGLLELRRRAGDGRLEPVAWLFLLISLLALPAGPEFAPQVERALGEGGPAAVLGLLRWAALAGVFWAFAWRGEPVPLRRLAEAAGALFLYVALAQLLPPDALPLIAPALLLLAALGGRRLGQALAPATITLAAVSLLWALIPLLEWLVGGAAAVGGAPMLVDAAVEPRTVATHFLLPAAALAGSAYILRLVAGGHHVRGLLISAAMLAMVGLHSLFKQLFAIGDPARFEALGLAQRLVWAGLLLAGAAAAWRGRARWSARPALALLALAAAYHFWFSLLLHNPLWSAQAVGALPLINLLLPLYAVPIMLLFVAERRGLVPEQATVPVHGVQMLLTALFALSTLRQLFHGALLVGGTVGQAEDIARSIVAIALAIGFLLWGIRQGQRSWRLGSLLLMLGAVAKVFLFDASGLEGLVRIASFVALGLSLIGIGWLYARQLRGDAVPA